MNIACLIQVCGGHELQTVKTIIEKRGVNVNATGIHYLRKTYERSPPQFLKIKGVSPLFVAAGYCNLEIVEYLIEKGANVNSRSTVHDYWTEYGGMSPLFSAISLQPHLEFSKRKAVIELLLAKGANIRDPDQVGYTPLSVAASGYFRFYFTLSYLGGNPDEPLLRFFLQREEISLMEKIDALELAGAMVILNTCQENTSIILKAFQYWNEALDLRENDQGHTPKVTLKVNHKVHWRAIEWTTKDQLLELQQRPLAEMEIQAIITSVRIMSTVGQTALLHHIRYIGIFSHCSNRYYGIRRPERYTQLLDICWIVLEGAASHNLRDRDFWSKIAEITEFLVLTLKNLREEKNPIVNSDSLQLSLELISITDQSHLHVNAYRPPEFISFINLNSLYPMQTIYKFFTILSENPEMVTLEMKSVLQKFLQLDGRDEFGRNLLLLACHRAHGLGTVRFLLELGAYPNAVDKEGNSPLHYVVRWMILMRETGSDSPLAELLLEYLWSFPWSSQ